MEKQKPVFVLSAKNTVNGTGRRRYTLRIRSLRAYPLMRAKCNRVLPLLNQSTDLKAAVSLAAAAEMAAALFTAD